MTLLAFAADRRAAVIRIERRPRLLSIDIACPRGPQQQQTRRTLQQSMDVTDMQTDARQFCRPCFALLCQQYQQGSHRPQTQLVCKYDVIHKTENTNASLRRQRRTEPRPQVTCTKNGTAMPCESISTGCCSDDRK